MNDLRLALAMFYYPRQALTAIKTERGRPSYAAGLAILLLIVVVRISYIYLTHYPLASLLPRDANLLLETVRFVVPLLTWVVAISAITSILDGEAMPRQNLKAATFSMLPYIVLTIPVALVSKLMGETEKALFSVLRYATIGWSLGLLIYAVRVLNDYSIAKTAVVCLLSILSMLLLWAVLLLAYALTGQLYSFLARFVTEVRMLYLE